MTKDVHTRHCCQRHGCKYGDEDCSVETGRLEQDYPCERCHEEEESFGSLAQGRTLISLTYIESHPDRERTFLGIFSSEAKATEAMNRHMLREKMRLPRASIGEWNYYFDEAELDQEV